MNRRHAAIALGAFAAFAARAQQSNPRRRPTPIADGIRGNTPEAADLLVTPEEAQRFGGAQGWGDPLPLRPRGVLPSIDIVAPAPGEQKVKTPFAISVRFHSSDAPIVPSSFRVLYGALKIDITDRIVKYARPTMEGFSFDQAQVPAGRHRLTLQVADEKQRVAEREIRIEVE